jgi:DNA-binding response OmpR family regulator
MTTKRHAPAHEVTAAASDGGGSSDREDEAAPVFSVDLHRARLFLPTARRSQPGELLTLKLVARGGLELRALARVLGYHHATAERGSGIEVHLLDVRTLEQASEPTLVSLRPPSLEPSGEEALRVLVADDDPRMRAQIAQLMRADGYEVFEAGNGADALGTAVKEKVALIISDVTMPVVDGWQFLRLARQRPELKDVPFLFHTSLDGDAERFRGYALGVDDYVDKPANPQDLAERVERALSRRRRALFEPRSAVQLRGDCAHVAFGTLLSLLEMEQRTGLLSLLRGAEGADIELHRGQVMAVRVTPAAGERDDLSRMLRVLDWNDAEFELREAAIHPGKREGLRASHILLAHAHRRDESAR